MKINNQTNYIEEQILLHRKLVDYMTLEYPVEVIVDKYLTGKDDDENEFFIPQYQRNFVWDDKRQSKFIESLFLGLPIPFLFLADVEGNYDGRVEVVDGSQRIRTLANYTTGGLKLEGLKKLDKLNDTYFSQLQDSRQKRFLRTNIKIIVLTEKANEEIRKDIFERINTGSDLLRAMEVRKGSMDGEFSKFISSLAENPLYKDLVPISERLIKRRENEELILRFFAYFENSEKFKHQVNIFMDEYLNEMNAKKFNKNKYTEIFTNMLNFIQKTLPHGFSKTKNAKSTPRVRFEALAVGAAQALEENPHLVCSDIRWIDSKEFQNHTRSDGSNSKTKLLNRLEYTKNKFLGK